MQVLQDSQMGTGEREGYWGPWHIPLNVNRGPHSVPGPAQVPHFTETSHHLLQFLILLFSIQQMRKWRRREGKSLAKGHTVGENTVQTRNWTQL